MKVSEIVQESSAGSEQFEKPPRIRALRKERYDRKTRDGVVRLDRASEDLIEHLGCSRTAEPNNLQRAVSEVREAVERLKSFIR